MTIAVPFENEMIFPHFGHTAQFKLYRVINSNVVSSQIVDTLGSGHSALAEFLAEKNVDVLICGCIGGCAKTALKEKGIRYCGGVSGDADEAVECYLADTLEFDPNINCAHHCGSHCC